MQGLEVMPFRAPPGIRMVRIDRASGKPVSGGWPGFDEPKPGIIWEAFKPQSEPRRGGRAREDGRAEGSRKEGRGARARASATAISCRERAASTRAAKTDRIPRRPGSPAQRLRSRPSPGRQLENLYARRSAVSRRYDQRRARAAAPLPQLGRGAAAARRAERARRGSGIVERSQGRAGGHARAPSPGRGDHRDPRDRDASWTTRSN